MTLSAMGVATFLIGLLPTYAQIGIAAPMLLLFLRVCQGVALGGEWGGAVLMAFEYSDKDTRAQYSCYPQIGLAVGLCLASGVIAVLSSLLSDAAFLSWGRSEEHTSELQSLMRNSYAVFCLKKKN